jgi:hypothetical protein
MIKVDVFIIIKNEKKDGQDINLDTEVISLDHYRLAAVLG